MSSQSDLQLARTALSQLRLGTPGGRRQGQDLLEVVRRHLFDSYVPLEEFNDEKIPTLEVFGHVERLVEALEAWEQLEARPERYRLGCVALAHVRAAIDLLWTQQQAPRS